MTTARTYVLGLGLAVTTVLFLVLAIGALGIVGDGGSPDRLFLAVPVVLVLGALVARLRPGGMVLALVATAATQLVVAVAAAAAVAADVRDFAGASIVDIIGISAMYAGLFGLAAWLFRRSDAQRSVHHRHGGSRTPDGVRS